LEVPVTSCRTTRVALHARCVALAVSHRDTLDLDSPCEHSTPRIA
jgi:hypothetical protein